MLKSPQNHTSLTVMYDGACPLCRREIGHYQGLSQGKPVCYIDISDAHQSLPPDTTRQQLLARFHVRRADGVMISGAAAFVALWSTLPGWRWLAAIARVPGVVWLMERSYRFFLIWRPGLQRVASWIERRQQHR